MSDGDITSEGEAASLAGVKSQAERFADVAMQAGACIGCGELGPCRCDPRTIHAAVARKAVDEVLGPDGPGPFPPSSGITRGGRAELFGIFDPRDGLWVWPDPALVEGSMCAWGTEDQAGVWTRVEATRIAEQLDEPGRLEVRQPAHARSMPVEHTEDRGR